ncbi:tetratricopeptide repeat protein [Candidatus Uabimicrobium sp. HlEnr_7]|uniref:tetratricopeptide repeat protein n=1 Tax=Candidatus Uabimicrobium helgolandensis TaxID=3095367 RepID=UPI003556B21B
MDNTNIDELSGILPLNTRVGNYVIQGVIGSGGMSVVYRAYDQRLKRTVALKIINKTQDSFEKLADEAQTMALLDHPNIVRIYDVGTVPCFYFAMEFVEGITLRQWLHQNNNYSIKHLAPILLQLAAAIETIHAKNIIHQDIKPSNVLISRNNVLKLMDFGISRAAPRMSGDKEKEIPAMGTPKYMAPEQISGKPSYKSDIYAFGATLYEVICGKPPFQGKSYNIMVDILTKEPMAPSILNSQVSSEIEAICLKCLHKKPQNRYVSAKQLIRDIKSAQSHQKILAKKYTVFQAAKTFAKRNLFMVTFVSGLIVLLVSFCFYLIQQEKKARLYAEKADQQEKNARLYAEKILALKNEADKVSQATVKILYKVFERHTYFQKNPHFLQPLRNALNQIPFVEKKYPDLYMIIAGFSSKEQNVKKSLQLLEKKIKNNPSNAFLYNTRGNIYLDNNMLLKAENDFKTAIRLGPKDVRGYSNLANLMKKQKRNKEAEKLYQKLIELNPNNPIIYYNRGIFFSTMGNIPKAIKDYQKAIEIDPQYSQAYHNLGFGYYRLGKFNNAIKNYTKAIALDKQNSLFFFNRARVYAEREDFEKAVIGFKKATNLQLLLPKAVKVDNYLMKCYSNLAATYMKLRQFDKAIENCSEGLKQDSEYAQLFHIRGISLFKKKDYRKTIVDLERALSLQSKLRKNIVLECYNTLVISYNNIAITYTSYQQFDKAIASYTKAISLNNKKWMLFYNRAKVYIKKKNYAKALIDLEKALTFDLHPEQSIKTKKYLEVCYKKQGLYYTSVSQFDKAIASYTKAISFNNKNWVIFYNRAVAYIKKKSNKQAVIDLEKANKLSPNQTLVNFHLGQIYYMQKHISKAKKCLQIALKKGDLLKEYIPLAKSILKKIGNKE